MQHLGMCLGEWLEIGEMRKTPAAVAATRACCAKFHASAPRTHTHTQKKPNRDTHLLHTHTAGTVKTQATKMSQKRLGED